MLHPELRLELQRDPALTPPGIIGRDAANQTDVAAGNPGSAPRSTGSSSPVAAVPFPMPIQDRRWLDQHQRLAPPTPVPAEPDPEDSVGRSEERPGPSSLKHGELLSEDGVLSRQRDAGSSHPTEGPKDQKEP